MANYNVRPKPGGSKPKKGKASTPGQTEHTPTSTDPNTAALQSLYGNTGVAAGEALVNKYLQPGSLGRMATPGSLSRVETGPSAAQSEAMQKMQAGLGGYSSPEYQASREQMQRGLNSNLATSLSQLAKGQARGKVFGAAATAQQGNQLRSAQDTKDNLEQDLMVKNIDEQRSRLGEYSNQANTLYGQNMAAQQTNLSQEQAERAAQTDAEKTNLGQQAAEVSGSVNALTGAGGQNLLQEALKRMEQIQKQGIRAVR